MRLGFPVKVMGAEGYPSNDTRRHQNNPHLQVSIEYLWKILEYLDANNIKMYRMSSDLAPYVTHPELPQFHRQIEECADELAAFGQAARERNIRLSLHPSQYIIINSEDDDLVTKSLLDLESQAALLDAMGLEREAVVVMHVGGLYNDREGSRDRYIRNYERLSEAAKRRVVLENDDQRFSVGDVLYIHQRTGVPLIYDYQHHMCLNLEYMSVHEALEAVLATWPADVRPKIHFSTPRTELRTVKRRNRQTGKQEEVLQPPIWTGHADYINPFEFINVLRQAPKRPFDVMLECKLKDVALLRLREDLPRYAPDIAARFGLDAK